MRSAIAGLALTALAALVGCTTNPATGEQTFTGGLSTEEEVAIGLKAHPQVLEQMGGRYADEDLQHYVDSVGQLLARTAERRDIKYTFTVLNSDIVNAFAIPGGYIYVTRGLLALANDEAELAAVLAHELGHITALHHARRHGQTMLANVGLLAAGVLAGTFAPDLAGSVMDAGQITAAGLLSSYSRENEFEADDLSIRYLSRAGYDPGAMARFLRTLRADSRLEAVLAGRSPDSVDQFDYLATHPAPEARVVRASDHAKGVTVDRPMTARDVYFRKIDGLLYGDDPDEGLVDGREFVHPKLGFRFAVPKGFRLRNTPKVVIAEGPRGAIILFDMATRRGARSMTDYLTGVWARRAAIRDLEAIEINGMDAATGTIRARTKRGAVDLRLVAAQAPDGRVYRFMFLTPISETLRLETDLQRTTYSLRRLTPEEAASIKPRRIAIITVRQGETLASLAQRMAVERRPQARLRVLNGLVGNETPSPGQAIKIVTR